jgi:hypothetical protein
VLTPTPAPAPAPQKGPDSAAPQEPVLRIPSQAGEPPLANIARASELEAASMPALQPVSASRTVQVVNRPIATIEFQAPESVSLTPELLQHAGHANDYSWITGQLHRIGEQWLIVYAADESNDLFGGRLALNTSVNMARFNVGDLVHVRGQVSSTRDNSDAPANYRADSIERQQR